MDNIKRLCLVKYDMTVSGGGERVTTNLANAFIERYEVHVVSIYSKNKDVFYPLDERIYYKVLIQGEGRIRETLLKGIKSLRSYIQEIKIDILFGIGVSVAPFIIPAAKGIYCKTVTCEHSNSLNKYENNLGQRICRSIGAKLSDRIVVLTKQDKEAYIKKYNLRWNDIEYIYNWMDNELLKGETEYNSQSKQIMSVIRIEPVKGVENIIEASKILAVKHPDWQWHIYGGGEEKYINSLKTQIKNNKLENFIIFKGKVTDIYDRYKDYSILVLTSYCEGLPMVLIEAKAKKIPIVCFDCITGPREIVRDGIDGYLVPVGNIPMLVEKLDLCIDSQQLRKSLSHNAYGNIELFKKNIILDKWFAFIDDLLE